MKNNTTQATKVITAHVPLPMADKVDQMAARLERSPGLGYQTGAFCMACPGGRRRDGLTLEAAWDNVTSGQVIDHQAVRPRADSLSTGIGYGAA